jgi:TatD DNase family protein
MSSYIDTHAHLYLPEFDSDRDTVVEAAVNRGIGKIFLPNIDSSSITKMNQLAERFPGICYPTMGLHPTSVKANYEEELERVSRELKTRQYYAIGETGIDLYWDKTFFHEQCLAFTRQLDLSVEYRLPVIIHARESFREILEILEDYRSRGIKGIFHAFTGSVEIAEEVISMGFKLGIGGILTYKNTILPDVVRVTGLENIVLETDSPYLTPVPFRGRRNECSYIPYIAETLAMILNTSAEEVGRMTSHNALQLFQPDSHA